MLIVGRSMWHSNRKKTAVGPGCTSTAGQLQERWCRFVVWMLVGAHQNSNCGFSLFWFNPICLDLADRLHNALGMCCVHVPVGTGHSHLPLLIVKKTPWKMITVCCILSVQSHEFNNPHFLWSSASFHCDSVWSINPHWGHATKWLNA